jgi:hypothetical protein
MFRIAPLAVLLLLSSFGFAQDLDPSLAPHAAQYNSELQVLATARKTKREESTRLYVQQLEAAMKASGVDAATVAILKKERDGVIAGLLVPANPAGLPADIVTARKAFLSGVGKASFDFATGKKKADDVYLKTLTDLAKKARAKTAPAGLSAQVAAERRRVLAR